MFECIRRSSSKLGSIKIPQLFLDCPPKADKLIKKTAEFIKDGTLPAIYVDRDYNLLDGYCSYLIATALDYKKAKILQFRKKKEDNTNVSAK